MRPARPPSLSGEPRSIVVRGVSIERRVEAGWKGGHGACVSLPKVPWPCGADGSLPCPATHHPARSFATREGGAHGRGRTSRGRSSGRGGSETDVKRGRGTERRSTARPCAFARMGEVRGKKRDGRGSGACRIRGAGSCDPRVRENSFASFSTRCPIRPTMPPRIPCPIRPRTTPAPLRPSPARG